MYRNKATSEPTILNSSKKRPRISSETDHQSLPTKSIRTSPSKPVLSLSKEDSFEIISIKEEEEVNELEEDDLDRELAQAEDHYLLLQEKVRTKKLMKENEQLRVEVDRLAEIIRESNFEQKDKQIKEFKIMAYKFEKTSNERFNEIHSLKRTNEEQESTIKKLQSLLNTKDKTENTLRRRINKFEEKLDDIAKRAKYDDYYPTSSSVSDSQSSRSRT